MITFVDLKSQKAFKTIHTGLISKRWPVKFYIFSKTPTCYSTKERNKSGTKEAGKIYLVGKCMHKGKHLKTASALQRFQWLVHLWELAWIPFCTPPYTVWCPVTVDIWGYVVLEVITVIVLLVIVLSTVVGVGCTMTQSGQTHKSKHRHIDAPGMYSPQS